MRTYRLSSSLVPFCLLLGSCTLNSIDPDTLIADEDDEVGETDNADDVGTGDADDDTSDGTSTEGSGTTDDGFDTDTEEESDAATDDDADTDASDSLNTTDDTTGDTTDTGGACGDLMLAGECGACLELHCCDLVLACSEDQVCACTWECIASGVSANACALECGPPSAATASLGECSTMMCSDVCS